MWDCFNNSSFSETCMGHVLHKNNLDKEKHGPFKIVIDMCIKKRFFFYRVTVSKMKAFENTNGHICVYY